MYNWQEINGNYYCEELQAQLEKASIGGYQINIDDQYDWAPTLEEAKQKAEQDEILDR
jgi:hypothetical protein